ncbi:MAG: DUF5992 family protein [Myxococcales bacterium]|nr:DUF5992 family protein [Myxococcales bacterium]MDD9970570.1 DUF5992 family protein [Myxococcales bacterium]
MSRSVLTSAIVAALLLVSSASPASASWLVSGAKITRVRAATRTSFGYWFLVTVSGGSGPCANQSISFRLIDGSDALESKLADFMLRTALSAYLSGRTVDIAANGSATSCSAADLIQVED